VLMCRPTHMHLADHVAVDDAHAAAAHVVARPPDE
jgi:hypothetical protein